MLFNRKRQDSWMAIQTHSSPCLRSRQYITDRIAVFSDFLEAPLLGMASGADAKISKDWISVPDGKKSPKNVTTGEMVVRVESIAAHRREMR
jgi:hypothetical protein